LAQAERLAPPALQAAVAAVVREAQQALGVVGAQPPEEAEVWDAVAAQRRAAGSASAEVRLQGAEAAGSASAEVQLQGVEAAGPASVAVRLRGAEVAAPGVEEAPLRAAQAGVLDAAAVRRRAGGPGVLLLAAASAGLPSTRPQGSRPAPSARAQSAHARGGLRTAQL
jgi:hypothetical protein